MKNVTIPALHDQMKQLRATAYETFLSVGLAAG
jgi:hypothetical protein